MTKDEKIRREVREEVDYICSPVKHAKGQVGFAPRIDFSAGKDCAEKVLESMIDTFGAADVFSLADRQYDQDSKNKVRAKFTKDAVTASAVVKALAAGTLKDAEVRQVMQAKNLEYIPAANTLMGIGKDAKVEPNKIHWDIL